jgi:hypothetical protein
LDQAESDEESKGRFHRDIRALCVSLPAYRPTGLTLLTATGYTDPQCTAP